MTEQTIKIDGIPEGYKAVSVTLDPGSMTYHDETHVKNTAAVTLEKIQPNRMVLEVTSEKNHTGNCQGFLIKNEDCNLTMVSISSDFIWREVKETDIPLTMDEPKLSLTKKDMLDLIEHLKLGGQLNPKIAEFVDYEQPEPKLSLSVEQCKKFIDGSIRDRSNFFQLVCEFIKDK